MQNAYYDKTWSFQQKAAHFWHEFPIEIGLLFFFSLAAANYLLGSRLNRN